MSKPTMSETVPQGMNKTFEDIATLTDEFSTTHLNDEYAQMIRYAIAALCRKRPSPLAKGRAKTWACGITHAIGMINVLSDPSQDPHMRASEIYQIFGVSASTGQAKSKLVRDTLKMDPFDPHWTLPSKLEDHPMAWMISYDGMILDARSLPLHIQEVAYSKGLIPYVPGMKEGPSSEKADQAQKGPSQKKTGSDTAIYQLEAFIIGGPIREEFSLENPEIVRFIELQGKNTLADLHAILFKAFDREDEHMYEFQLGGLGPNDPNAQCYGVSGDKGVETAKTAIATLGLSVNDSFGYWFDFGDDWWHQVNVIAIEEKGSKGKYPKITGRVGASPPQYADFD